MFDFEQSSSDLDEDRRTAPRGWIACLVLGCIILTAIGLLVWGAIAWFPSSTSPKSLEKAPAAMYDVSTNISDSTANLILASDSANNSAPDSTLSFVGTGNDTTSSPLEERALPPTLYCDINDDCDWGQVCSDGLCQPGCASEADCHRPQRCKEGQCIHRPSPCLIIPCEEKCLEHFYICGNSRECCSGICRRSSRDRSFKVCQIGSRQNGGRAADEEATDEE